MDILIDFITQIMTFINDLAPVNEVTAVIDLWSILPLLVIFIMGRIFYKSLTARD